MEKITDLAILGDRISKIKELLLELQVGEDQIPAITRNTKRALASVKMMELNICDATDLDKTVPLE